MSRLRIPVALLAATLLTVGVAHAAIVPTSQNRVLSANASAADNSDSGTDTDGSAAADFGPFDDAVAASVLLSGAIGSGGGSQTSSIHPEMITAAGTHFANGEGWESGAWGDGYGSSRCQVFFDLTEDTDYTLEGWVEEFDSGSSYVRLVGPSGTVHSLFPPHNDTLVFAESGVLLAGSYELDVRTSGSAFGANFFADYASGAYDVTFTIPTATASPTVAAAGNVVAAPNPFRATTTIAYGRDLEETRVTIHDLAGRLVRAFEGPRGGATVWDARDGNGRRVPAGVYFVSVASADETRQTKVTVLR